MPRSRTAIPLVLINRGSGGADGDRKTERTVREALERAGIDPVVETLAGRGIAKHARAAAAARVPLLIVAGGDGSVSAAAAGLAGSRTTLGILPLGTLNHFARDLGIPLDVRKAAELIASGSTRRVDVGAVNRRTFINNSAIGLYPLMVVERESQQRRLGRSKRLAMAVAAVRTLARFGRTRLTLTVNRRRAHIDTPLLFVGNNDYSLELPGAGRRESLDRGELCVLVMRKKTRRGFLAAALRALAGRSRRDDMVRLDKVRRLRVDSPSGALTLSIDGETVRMKPPLTYCIARRALRVVAPLPV